MASNVFNTIKSSVPCSTSPRGGVMVTPVDKQQETTPLPVDCQQESRLTSGHLRPGRKFSSAPATPNTCHPEDSRRSLKNIEASCTSPAIRDRPRSVDAHSRAVAAYARLHFRTPLLTNGKISPRSWQPMKSQDQSLLIKKNSKILSRWVASATFLFVEHPLFAQTPPPASSNPAQTTQ